MISYSHSFTRTVLIVMLLMCASKTKVVAQPYVLYQGNNEALYVRNVLNGNWRFLSSDAFGNLAGYELINDTLHAYFEINGRLKTLKFSDSMFAKLSGYEHQLNPLYEETHVSPQVFSYKDYKLVVGNQPCLYENDNLLWGESCKEELPETTTSWLTGYIHPQISPKLNAILFELKRTPQMAPAKSSIIEVDIATGKEKVIAKGKNPRYSPDGAYILFQDNAYADWRIYSIEKGKIIDHSPMVKAFWLHR